MQLTRLIAGTAIVAIATAGLLLPSSSPAHAAGKWTLDLNVHRNGGADMTIIDTLSPSTTYVIALAATGGGTCSLAAGQTVIADADYDIGAGSVTASTQGSCNLYTGAVTYEMSWAPIGGSPGHLEVQCVWLLGPLTPTCTLKHLQGDLISGLPA